MTMQRARAGEVQRTARVITRGRVSGLPHIATVRFVRDGEGFLLLAGGGRSDWSLNILASGGARLRMGELIQEVTAVKGSEADRARALAGFRRKYGQRVVNDWYSGAGVCLRLEPSGPPVRRGSQRGESEVELDLRRWRERRLDYYGSVVEAFDSAAEEYDFTISQNFINTWIRARSVAELLGLARRDDALLEIGCGTGAEALRIAGHVRRVVATDISAGMVEALRMKVRARGLQEKIVAVEARASEVSRLAPLLDGGRVRVAYSFNGALDCEPEIERFPDELSEVLDEDGFFVCSVRNTLCLSEAVLHAMVLQFGRMSPRKRQPVMVSVGGKDIPSYYYSPSRFVRLFSKRFAARRVIGLPSILPPAYLSDRYLRVRPLLSFVERIEARLSGTFPLNRFGDQTLFVFQKRGRPRP